MATNLKSGDRAVIDFGDGLTTPITILGGLLGAHYKVACDFNRTYHPNSNISQLGEHTVLDYQGHKVIIDVLGTDGEQSKVAVWLNDGWIAEYLISPIK